MNIIQIVNSNNNSNIENPIFILNLKKYIHFYIENTYKVNRCFNINIPKYLVNVSEELSFNVKKPFNENNYIVEILYPKYIDNTNSLNYNVTVINNYSSNNNIYCNRIINYIIIGSISFLYYIYKDLKNNKI